jgi:hypothetical protein
VTQFRGAIVESRWHSTWPFNWLRLSEAGVTLGPGILRPVTLVRWEGLQSVTVERLRHPFAWRTILWIAWRDGDGEHRLGFIARWTDRPTLLRELRRHGAAVADP